MQDFPEAGSSARPVAVLSVCLSSQYVSLLPSSSSLHLSVNNMIIDLCAGFLFGLFFSLTQAGVIGEGLSAEGLFPLDSPVSKAVRCPLMIDSQCTVGSNTHGQVCQGCIRK